MKQPLSIGDISNLLGVPKSTLRFWEGEGIIDLPRNDSNNYREYSLHTLVSLSDMVYYRSLNMPLKEMKKLKEVSPLELEHSLSQLEHKLEAEIETLLKSKEELKKRKAVIECYMSLLDKPYQEEKIDFNKVYSFAYDSAKAWAACIKDQYANILYYDVNKQQPEIGMTVSYSKENQLLWESDETSHKYLTFPLIVEYGNPQSSDFKAHLAQLKQLGFRSERIFGRYLFSAVDGRHGDFYKGYAEVL